LYVRQCDGAGSKNPSVLLAVTALCGKRQEYDGLEG